MTGYQGLLENAFYQNHPSMLKNIEAARAKIANELRLGRIAGPFSSPPFQLMRFSPLGLIPKPGTSQYRLIHDLSWPRGTSVNDGIPRECSSVSYDTVETVVALVREAGRGALIAKCDITDAFRLIPIHPSQYPLLGMTFAGGFYFDRTLPMGLSSSCAIFEEFSKALVFSLGDVFNITSVSHLIDDFIFVAPGGSNVCSRYLNTFLTMGEALGIPFKQEKTVLPTVRCKVYGLIVDSEKMQVELPLDKMEKIRSELLDLSSRRKVTVRTLQSVLGRLNYASYVIAPGRPFLRRLTDLLKNKLKHFHVYLNREAKLDVECWLAFMSQFNGKRILGRRTDLFKVFSDASGSFGYAAVFGSHWFVGTWGKDQQGWHITVKELVPLVYAVATWGPVVENQAICFYCDNKAVCDIVNGQSSRDPTVMGWVRPLVVLSLKYNVAISASHISGSSNVICDKLSRLQESKVLEEFQWLDRHPTVPVDPWTSLGNPLRGHHSPPRP